MGPLVLAALQVAASTASQDLAAEGARDATGEGIAFVEASAPPATWYVEQPIRIRFSIGVEEEFLRTKIVQPFGAHLDLPVQLSAPWLEHPGDLHVRGLAAAVEGPARPALASLVVNETLVSAARAEDRLVEGRRFHVYALEAIVLPRSAGAVSLPAPVLGFAYATRFTETFLSGRTPADRVDAFVAGEPLVLEIRSLPESGRPPDFTGAVGAFSVSAAVRPRQVVLGGSVKLDLTIEGEGNLELFDLPRWTELGGFRVLGMVDEVSPAARKLVYDLVPRSEKVWQVPAIDFAYFDPAPPAGYRTASTAPIEVVVLAPGEPTAPAPDPEHPVSPARRSAWGWTLWAALAAIAVLAVSARRR